MALKPKQIKFCHEFISNGGNITQAMQSAGYSKAYADAKGYLFIQNPEIKAHIEQLQEKVEETMMPGTIAGATEVLEYWTWAIRNDKELGVTSKAAVEASKMLAKVLRMEGGPEDREEIQINVRIEGLEEDED